MKFRIGPRVRKHRWRKPIQDDVSIWPQARNLGRIVSMVTHAIKYDLTAAWHALKIYKICDRCGTIKIPKQASGSCDMAIIQAVMTE